MIAAFLLPFPVRGYRAPFLWVYYRLLSSFDEPLLFIANEDYLRRPESWIGDGRWETQTISGERLGFGLPTAECMDRHRYRFLPDELFESILEEQKGNPVAVYRRILTERVPSLEAAIASCLDESEVRGIEAILTWCNCPSLNAVAAANGLRVVHLELGPLRWPLYRTTAYLDFRGVNGNTEAEARYRSSGISTRSLTVSGMRRFFASEAIPDENEPAFDLGVALQVEDDSNLIAFGNGFDNQSLLVHAHYNRDGGRVLVRAHPGSLFSVKPDWYEVDASPNSIDFLRCCRRVLTINSSVGLEALMLGIPATVLGECSYRFIAEAPDAKELALRLAHYLFAYLVPIDLIYQPSYIRFRLEMPSDEQIVSRHILAYLGEQTTRAAFRGSGFELMESILSSTLPSTK